jgi:hypothetical protein
VVGSHIYNNDINVEKMLHSARWLCLYAVMQCMADKGRYGLEGAGSLSCYFAHAFSLGIHQTEDVKICQGVGLLLHYLTLSSLLWMAVTAR